MNIKYHHVYCYELDEDVVIPTRVRGFMGEVDGGWVQLLPTGELKLKKGYSWNGCTGVPDLKGTEVASLAHDGLYQLIDEGKIPKKARAPSDGTFRDLMQQNGLRWSVRWVYYLGVRIVGWAFC